MNEEARFKLQLKECSARNEIEKNSLEVQINFFKEELEKFVELENKKNLDQIQTTKCAQCAKWKKELNKLVENKGSNFEDLQMNLVETALMLKNVKENNEKMKELI